MHTEPFSRASLWLITLTVLLTTHIFSTARAHELQPVVMDVTIGSDIVEISADWMIESAVSDLDLSVSQDTAAAENGDDYDRLRALSPDQLADTVRAAWPVIAGRLELSSEGERLPLTLESIDVRNEENIEVARLSRLKLSAPLQPGNAPLEFRADPELGPFVVRVANVENGYAEFLAPGMSSGDIPRSGSENQTGWEAFVDYIAVGFDHIIPKGLDHILFVLGLFFLSTRMGPLIWQVSAFTIAHTVTLALGALDVVRIPASVVEPLIAASIVYVGIENVFFRSLSPWRPFVVFGFGLLHGLGFASVLMDFGLGNTNFVPKLVGFNIGVEIGQLAVIAAAWLTLKVLFDRYQWYHRRIAAPVSIAIAAIAAFWVFERTAIIGTDGAWALFSRLTEGGFNPFWVTAVAVFLTSLLLGVQVLAKTNESLRDSVGTPISLLMFFSLVALFTSTAWIMCVFIAAVWILALSAQILGEPEV